MCIDDSTKRPKNKTKWAKKEKTTAKQLMEMQQESVMDSMIVCILL